MMDDSDGDHKVECRRWMRQNQIIGYNGGMRLVLLGNPDKFLRASFESARCTWSIKGRLTDRKR